VGLLNKIKNRLTGRSLGYEASLSVVSDELSQGIKQDDIWQMAEAQSQGDASLTKLVYTKLRAEQLQQKADEKIAVIQREVREIEREAREIERRKRITEKEVEAIYQRNLIEHNKRALIEAANDAIQFLKDSGYVVNKYPVGKKAIHWDIENGSSFYKARSLRDIVEYADQVRLSRKLN